MDCIRNGYRKWQFIERTRVICNFKPNSICSISLLNIQMLSLWFLHFTISLFWIILHEYSQIIMRHFPIQHCYIILVSYHLSAGNLNIAWNTTNCSFSPRGHSSSISIMEGSGLCLGSLCSGYEDLEHRTGFKGLFPIIQQLLPVHSSILIPFLI